MVLFVNCCPRDNSRTELLAKKLLDTLGGYEEVNPEKEGLVPIDNERLNYRTMLLEKGDLSDEIFKYAKQFAAADTIVIAAPFWDLSFPSILKIYIENIYVTGIVSEYDENGTPKGLCKAKKLYYVTTAGGAFDGRFSFDYLKELGESYFGIKETVLINAEMLDIIGNDPEKILEECVKSYQLG